MKYDGGPAFPSKTILKDVVVNGVHHEKYECFESGATLRDYFAAEAMQGLIAAMYAKKSADEHFGVADLVIFAPGISEDSYRFADAMIKARGE